MTPIQTNKPVFFDDDGNVLEGGQIYIGQPSTDPRTNPKTVTFRDSGGAEFTAQQPLETVAGRISYNGKPIVSLVDGEYSMLILDAAGKQLDDGYSRSINAAGTEGGGIADFSEVTRVGLTLDEIKAFDVAVGDTVENVGKSTPTDSLGARWLAVSATGSPGDDVTLIDFANGLQGRKQENFVYSSGVSGEIVSGSFKPESPTQVWSGSSTSVNVTDLSESGPGWYVVSTGIADLTFYAVTTDGSNIQAGATYVFGGNDYTAWITASTPGAFRVTRTERDSPFGQTLETITAIYKV